MPIKIPTSTKTKPGTVINNKGRFSATSQMTQLSTEKPCEAEFLVDVFFKFSYLHETLVLTNPKQYNEIIEVLKPKKEISLELRKKLAIEAYSHTAQYDSIISQYLQNRWTEEILPENPTFTMRKIQDMRYGENPHQKGAFYKALPIASIITGFGFKTF